MKTLLLISLMFTGLTLSSQELTGFWGLKFGSSISQAENYMATKPGCVLGPVDGKDDLLMYKGGTFAGKDIDFIALQFYKGAFYSGVVFLTPATEERAIPIYKELKADLTAKYSAPQKDYENYKYPYEKGDGHELTAIKLEKLKLTSLWFFDNASITLSISKDLQPALFYSETKMQTAVSEAAKTKEANDL